MSNKHIDTDEMVPCPKCDGETHEIKIWRGFRNNYFGHACNAVLDNDRD
jgi:hypothetical protein